MTFCWVPKGECQLGSPKAERDAVLLARRETMEAEWLQLEAEEKRPKIKTDGFWTGKYEVTQAEWKAVMGDNPSHFDGTKDNNAKGLNTARFPVENVSWDRICGKENYLGVGFLDKVNAHGGVRKAFGNGGKFALPHEDEWEYACRGGRGNVRPFYWGDKLNGTQANIDGTYPFGTTDKGTSLWRTCAVDATDDTKGNKYEVHPWGLMHMHGNVLEWCESTYPFPPDPVVRGGYWGNGAYGSRAAYRFRALHGSNEIGFRVCLRLN